MLLGLAACHCNSFLEKLFFIDFEKLQFQKRMQERLLKTVLVPVENIFL